MKARKITIAFLLLLFINQIVLSQEFQVPKNAKFENAQDYKKYEKTVLQGINWLENTKVEQQEVKRTETSTFLMKWIIETPTLSIGLQTFQMDLTKKNPDLLLSFLGGWTKFAIENPSEKDNILAANIAGIQSIIKVYSSNKGNGIKKDKKIEKLIKLDKIKLEKWVKKQIE